MNRSFPVVWLALVIWTSVSCASEPAAEVDSVDVAAETLDTEASETGGDAPAETQEDIPSETADDVPAGVDTATDAQTDAEIEGDVLAPWQPPSDPFDWPLAELQLDIDALDRALLESNPQAGVVATVTFADQPPVEARVTLSGEVGFDGKPSLSVRFGRDESVVVFGTDGLRLDPMSDDPSQMRGRLVHLLADHFGMVVPRATHATVTVGELELGLYTVIEPVTSPSFLERATGGRDPTRGSVFVNQDQNDLWPWQVAEHLLVSGADEDRAGLVDLAEALEDFRLARLRGEPIPLRDALGGRVALEPFVEAMALQVVLGHWGGYTRSLSRYALHVTPPDPAQADAVARVTFLPLGLDLSLADDDWTNPWVGGGKLFWLCRDDPDCRRAYGAALARHATPEVARELVTMASQVRLMIGHAIAADLRRTSSPEEVRVAQDRLLLTLEQQPGWVAANLSCADPMDADADGDGYSVCVDDCDDDRADVHPGAPEQCNLRDDDCDWVLDDDPSCPDCLEVASPREGLEWLVCYAPKTWEEAAARCEELDGVLASIASEDEHTAFLRATLGLQWTSWWLGLSDRDVEGIFAWADGEPLAFTLWASGEPNDSGEREDCGQLVPWSGQWNDLDCGRRLPFVCQRPDRQ